MELLALDDTIFETICEDGAIPGPGSLSNLPEPQSLADVTQSDIALLQAAHDWFEMNLEFPTWLPSPWNPTDLDGQ